MRRRQGGPGAHRAQSARCRDSSPASAVQADWLCVSRHASAARVDAISSTTAPTCARRAAAGRVTAPASALTLTPSGQESLLWRAAGCNHAHARPRVMWRALTLADWTSRKSGPQHAPPKLPARTGPASAPAAAASDAAECAVSACRAPCSQRRAPHRARLGRSAVCGAWAHTLDQPLLEPGHRRLSCGSHLMMLTCEATASLARSQGSWQTQWQTQIAHETPFHASTRWKELQAPACGC